MAQVPYEFLVRWNHLTGEFQGAHVKTYDNVAMREGDAQPVAVASANGFPLSAVLTAVETGAIIATDNAVTALNDSIAGHAAKDSEIAALKARITAVETGAIIAADNAATALNDSIAGHAAKDSEIAALKARIAAIEAAAAINP